MPVSSHIVMIYVDSKQFDYHLPNEKIALHPVAERSSSKLLFYNKGKTSHHHFSEIPLLLPKPTTLVFNDTKVFPARLIFHKATGRTIEVFLLKPLQTEKDISENLQIQQYAQWECLIKNKKKWKPHTSLHLVKENIELTAYLNDNQNNIITFHWQPSTLPFIEIIKKLGVVPLPPYLRRKSVFSDIDRYQTVYSNSEGAVAAPTAGLHFSNVMMRGMKKHDILKTFLTLHVGAGTFQPIRTKNIAQHDMHSEQMIVSKDTLETLLIPNQNIIAVGTTSVRALESLYWMGVKILENKKNSLIINQLEHIQKKSLTLPSTMEALQAVRETLKTDCPLVGQTSLFIFPEYHFHVCRGLITNFHMPNSSLIPLIAALIGKHWKKTYQIALDTGYRFLSYGDSSFLLP